MQAVAVKKKKNLPCCWSNYDICLGQYIVMNLHVAVPACVVKLNYHSKFAESKIITASSNLKHDH